MTTSTKMLWVLVDDLQRAHDRGQVSLIEAVEEVYRPESAVASLVLSALAENGLRPARPSSTTLSGDTDLSVVTRAVAERTTRLVNIAPVRASCSPGRATLRASVLGSLPTWKRGLDLAILIFLAPMILFLMAIVAAAIRLTSPGPAIFRQERIGFHGIPFLCFKFRTMNLAMSAVTPCENFTRLMATGQPIQKLDSRDSRLIYIGAFLRASGLDELPQVINILLGEMSFVGPRPCVRYEYERYLAADRERCDSVPGLTGLWQVSDKNHSTFREMIELDVQYGRNFSLAQDLQILCRTPAIMVAQMRELRPARRCFRLLRRLAH